MILGHQGSLRNRMMYTASLPATVNVTVLFYSTIAVAFAPNCRRIYGFNSTQMQKWIRKKSIAFRHAFIIPRDQSYSHSVKLALFLLRTSHTFCTHKHERHEWDEQWPHPRHGAKPPPQHTSGMDIRPNLGTPTLGTHGTTTTHSGGLDKRVVTNAAKERRPVPYH